MDNLVLTRVADVLNRTLAGSALCDLRQESHHRFRLVFESAERPLSLQLSIEARDPWIGCPPPRRRPIRLPPGSFASAVGRALAGRVVAGLTKGPDRVVRLRFTDGQVLMAELIPHRAHLLLLDSAGRIQATARLPRSDRGRLAPGESYAPPDPPPGRLDPLAADPERIDRHLAGWSVEDGEPVRGLRRRLLGVGEETARLVLEESRRSGRSPGEVLAHAGSLLRNGVIDPVLERPRGAQNPVEHDPGGWHLFPWEPPFPSGPDRERIRGRDAAATAGIYHGALELHGQAQLRAQALFRILAAEIKRHRRAEARIETDIAGFEAPERYRHWGEALLAGLHEARRVEGQVLVADPYDTTGRLISIPVPGDRTLQQAADGFFRKFRRAQRGLEQARGRSRENARRRERLESLQARFSTSATGAATEELSREMREMGIAVGLEPPRGRRAPASGPSRPRLEGVRLFTAADGSTILVGKGGKENDRLTFKLAGPDDFWFHALGVPGAHVVLRNEDRAARPPQRLLREAAAVAAWFSEARKEPQADVQWTRRKYVRRLKGARPGTVTVKKSETVRVRPGLPASSEADSSK